MSIFSRFYPKEYKKSTYDIDFKKLYMAGYRGVIFDIDNTLVPHGAPADKKAESFFADLKEQGYHACLLSNNKEPRVAMFNKNIGVMTISKGGKPNPKGYMRAMSLMKTTRDNTLFVGDQLFTDVWGANRAGIYSILVEPIHPKEEIQIVLKRKLERIVLHFYRRDARRHGR